VSTCCEAATKAERAQTRGCVQRAIEQAQARGRERLAIQFASDMLRAGNTDVDAVEFAAWKLAAKFVPYPGTST
jgi:hypothetical protein